MCAPNRRRSAPTCSSRKAQPYDPAAADRSLKALFATGLFSDVVIDMQGSTLVVKVTENPIINRVAFEGNSKIEDDKLRDEVQSKPRQVFTRARVQSDVERILTIYRRGGRYNAVGRAQDHQARPGPRRPRLRDQRGRRHGRAAHQLRRQREFQRRHAARQDPHQRERLVPLPVVGRPLRSRSPQSRSRTAAQVLPLGGLRRFPRRLGGRRAGARTARASSSPSRSARANATSSARSRFRPASRGSMSTS